MQIKVKGLENIPMNLASRKTELRETFNKNLRGLVFDWLKTSSTTFVNKEGKAGFEKVTEVTPLSRLSGGTRGTVRAKISLTVKAVPLTDFFVNQQRVSVNKSVNAASVKRGKYMEKRIGVQGASQIFTRAKILKQTGAKLVIPRGKKGALSSAEGLKGFMYSPRNRVAAKPGTPLGIYVRLQKATWKGKQRLPTYKIFAPPLAIAMLSPRILKRIKFQKRLENLFND